MQSNAPIKLLFRGAAFMIDLMVSAGIAMLIREIFYKIPFVGTMFFVIGVGFILMLFRDVFGKSIGKYLLGLKIVDFKTQSKAKFYQRCFKNITLPLWMIETPIVIFSKNHRRIGDLLASTEITMDENSYAFKVVHQFLK